MPNTHLMKYPCQRQYIWDDEMQKGTLFNGEMMCPKA